MKMKRFWQGIFVLILVLGMVLIACDVDKNNNTDNNKDNESGGILTITDIPDEYNGKYAMFIPAGFIGKFALYGCQNLNYDINLNTF